MKAIALLACGLLACAGAKAQFGVYTPSEVTRFTDPGTGVELTLLTDTAKNDRFMYQTDPMWTADGNHILFRSSGRQAGVVRKGKGGKARPQTQYYFVDVPTGRIVQATDGEGIGGVFLANRSNRMFFSRREGDKWNMYAMELGRFFADADAGKCGKAADYATLIGTFPGEMGRPGGFCVNSDDSYAFITVSREGTEEERRRMEAKAFRPRGDQPLKVRPALSGIRKMDLHTGEVTSVIDTEFRIGHIQASRFAPHEIVFCNETGGDADQRMWYCRADSLTYRPLYRETPLDWVTHETFASKDYVYFNILGFQSRLRKQATGIFRINLRTDDVEPLGQVELGSDGSMLRGRGFWHCNASRDDKWATGDTFAGNVWIINTETGERHRIATGTVMRPDHAQPSFSPDGTRLLFQSGRFSGGKRLTLVMVDLTQLPYFPARR